MQIFSEVLPANGDRGYFGKLVATSHMYMQEQAVDDAIKWFEEQGEVAKKRPLIELYAAKGYIKRGHGKAEEMRHYFEKAHNLACSEFPTHLSEQAEIHQLFARSLLYVADWCVTQEQKRHFYEAALDNFKKELVIRESLFSSDHPFTKQACRNCVLLLDELHCYDEADAFETKYGLKFC